MILQVVMALATCRGFTGSLSRSQESCPSLKNHQTLQAYQEFKVSLSLIRNQAKYQLLATDYIPVKQTKFWLLYVALCSQDNQWHSGLACYIRNIQVLFLAYQQQVCSQVSPGSQASYGSSYPLSGGPNGISPYSPFQSQFVGTLDLQQGQACL